MKAALIEIVRRKVCESSGPWEIVTLGIKIGQTDIIQGEYYFGPGHTKGEQMAYDQARSDLSRAAKILTAEGDS